MVEKQQKFCVAGSCFAAKKIQNSKKRKECEDQQSGSEVFNEYPSWVKKPKTCSAASSIASSRTPGRVVNETRVFYDNWVNSTGRDSRNNGLSSGLLSLSIENHSCVKKPKTSAPIGSMAASRNPGMVLQELNPFDDERVTENYSCPDSKSKESIKERRVAFNLRRMKPSYGLKDLLEEGSRGVSTQLSLYHHYPFKIKKKMKPSDLGNLCRLLVSADLVKKHILPFLKKDQIKQLEVKNQEINGLKVWVWDMNTESMHQLVFKRWSTSKSYIFNDGWTKQFVKRRNLVEGDEIGLFWDNDHSRFHFSVLSRTAATG
ncbi:unnamed protein product [Dovyalis caffra]|uniref:TF-B3 domain-containing protein n=1 Tax=Dovyalis caffra TaxID=77055 RepID=A0AAV1RM24_9ROSI|nr:unnamed protein product [Dovyalis caffra]